MGAGANIGGFGAGFGKGLANALLSNRDRADQKKREQQQRQDRLFQAMLPTLIDNVEDVADLEPFFAQHLPEQFGGKPGKKGGSPFDNIKRFLGPLIGMRQQSVISDDPNRGGITGNLPRATQPPGVTGGTLDSLLTPQPRATMEVRTGEQFTGQPLPQPINAAPGGTPLAEPPTGSGLYDLPGAIPPSQDASVSRSPITDIGTAGQTAATAAIAAPPPNRRTLLGVPIMSPAEKFERNEQRAEMQIAARRRLAERLGLPPEAAMAYALTGELTQAKPGEGFTLGPDQVRFGPGGQEIARGPAKPPSAADIPNTIDEAIVAADRAGNQAEVQRLLELKSRSSAAGREPKGAQSDEATAIAEMAADNPSTLQGLTPTLTGQAMAALKRNPQLYARYEAVRMQPIRQTATTMIDAIKKLVILDKDGNIAVDKNGKLLGLSDGGRAMFGEWTPAMARGLVMGQAGTDAAAALAQLTGQQVLDTIAEMKRQSKTGATGFGAMNIAELNVLESAATQLKKRLSEGAAAGELEKLFNRYMQILGKSQIELQGTPRPGASGTGSQPGQSAVPISGPEWRGGKLYVNGQPIG